MIQHFEERIPCLNTESLEREDFMCDSEISVEEVEHALKRLKPRKVGGQDGTVSKHLKFDG